jgi:hypothetical protein
MNTNANRDDVEYQLQLLERKRDAQIRMKQTAKFLNGDFHGSIADEFVGKAKNLTKKINRGLQSDNPNS